MLKMLDENLEKMKPESTKKINEKDAKKAVVDDKKETIKKVKETKKPIDSDKKIADSELSKPISKTKTKTIKESESVIKEDTTTPENIEVIDSVKLDNVTEIKIVEETDNAKNKTTKESDLSTEKVKESKPQELSVKDYENLSLEDLVTELGTIVNNGPINKIKDDVEGIKSVFTSKFSKLLASKKATFIEEGGNSIDFYFSTPYKSNYNTLMAQYKKERAQYYKQLEQQFQDNLKIRLDIIEALKNLIDDIENSNKYGAFKALQERWHDVGPIPRNKYNDTWQTYLHHVERFYDLLHLNKDLRDLDFKHNLEKKEKLINRAEDLAQEPNIDIAFKELQQLHKIWKEDIGPVDKEVREEVWNRFSLATKLIHDKRHEAFRDLKGVFDENANKKESIITEMTSFNTDELKTHSDWQRAIKVVEKLRDDFFGVGRVSRKQNETLWKKFKEVTRAFNSKKNDFYKTIKADQLDNLTKKRALLSQAQSLKDAENINETIAVFKKIQADWKNIGHVPRKYSDKIWHEFKDACNHFFDRLHSVQDEDNKGLVEAFNDKKAYLDNLEKKVEDESFEPLLEDLEGYIKEWKDMGSVPKGMGHIEGKFNKFLEKGLESLKLGKNELALIKFKILMDGYKASNNIKKIEGEQFFLMKKIDELTRETQQLKNNMGFFSNTTEANPLFANVNKTLEKHQEDIIVLKEKLDYLRKI